MGADDYYCYDTVTTDKSEYTPAPMGGVAMMDCNVTDHDAFTKLSFNWVKPYVVTGNATITINPMETNGDCILIPAKGSTWNGTAFDEYMPVTVKHVNGSFGINERVFPMAKKEAPFIFRALSK